MSTTTKQEEAAFAPAFAQPKTVHKGGQAKNNNAPSPADLTQQESNPPESHLSPEEAAAMEEYKQRIKESREELLELMRACPTDTDPDVLALGPETWCTRCGTVHPSEDMVLVRLPVCKVTSDEEVMYERKVEPICPNCWTILDNHLEKHDPSDLSYIQGEWDVL